MLSTYQNFMMLNRDAARTFARYEADPTQSRAEKYYRDNIGKIKTVDEFVNNSRLFTYAVNAFGLQDMQYAKALMKKVLTSDLTDSKSVANKFTDSRYQAFAAAFQFDTNGNVKDTSVLQSQDQSNDTITRYQNATKGDIVAPIETFYVQQNLAKVTKVDDLLANSRLLKDVLTAYGVASDTPQTTLRSALVSDASDPSSFVNTKGTAALKAMVADFNFDSTGAITTQRSAQTGNSFTAMAKLYARQVKFNDALTASLNTESAYVQKIIGSARSVDDIVNDTRVVKYIGTAFGQPEIDSGTLRSVLTSNLTDPKSKANVLGPAYRKLAAYFQFNANGLITRDAPKTAQDHGNIENTVISYVQNTIESQAGTDSSGTQLALYFTRKASSISSPYEILADKALWKFVQTTFGLPASVGDNIDQVANTIKAKINLSDLRNPKKVDALVGRFSAMYDLQNNASSGDPILQLFR